MTPLRGLKIFVPESRELDLFVSMLETEGATVLRCPMVRIVDLDNTAEAEAWIEIATSDAFTDIIWLTGDGIRRILALATRTGREREFLEALRRVRLITRGPKPARALRELGLTPGLAVLASTSEGVAVALLHEKIAGRSIGVQLYPGEGAQPLVDELRAQGAKVFPVTPYRYTSDTESGQVAAMIHALVERRIGLVAFTASPQIERLFQVAKDTHLEAELNEGLTNTPIAAMGPVVEETLRRHGLSSAIRPETNFHLKPLVRAIIAWRTA